MVKRSLILCAVLMGMLWAAPLWAGGGKLVQVSGNIALAGIGPMENGMALFFEDSMQWPPPAGSWVKPAQWAPVDINGRFSILVPMGRYRLCALERDPSEGFGPPKPGERFFVWKGEGGKERIIGIEKPGDLELGVIRSTP